MTPRVSVIIVSYNMSREIPRTVRSFLPPYQQGLADGDVEVLVMENGSSAPIPLEIRRDWPATVRYIEAPNPQPSPAHALNLGARLARAEWLCPVIDGARMASPGLLGGALDVATRRPTAFVSTLGLHLGPKPQQLSALDGYDQQAEDALLADIGWPMDGYRLFEIASLAGSGPSAWFGPIFESNAPVLSAAMYRDMGGYDAAFSFPGGGIVNHDFFNRAIAYPGVNHVLLLGEATFHQVHGGVTTSRSVAEVEADGRSTWQRYVDQYQSIRNRSYVTPSAQPHVCGVLPPSASAIAAQGLAAMSASRTRSQP